MHTIAIHIGFYSILIASSYYIDLMRSGDVVASAIDHKVSPRLMWLQLEEMITVLVSYGGCSKMPPTWHLKIAEMNSFIVLVAGNPRPHKAVLCWGTREKPLLTFSQLLAFGIPWLVASAVQSLLPRSNWLLCSDLLLFLSHKDLSIDLRTSCIIHDDFFIPGFLN